MMEEAADAGHPLAQFNQAQIILEGRPNVEGEERAIGYFRASAEAGHCGQMRNMPWRRFIWRAWAESR